jgi:hypothetical protein
LYRLSNAGYDPSFDLLGAGTGHAACLAALFEGVAREPKF